MNKQIKTALISVFYKDGLTPVVQLLHRLGVTLYSTGGTQKFIEELGLPVVPVESLTTYPSILGGRVKTLHPSVFGGILGRRNHQQDLDEMQQYGIPQLDLVIVDLYPFEETVAATQASSFTGSREEAEAAIIEKIDIGGPSMIRAAAKNFADVAVLASKEQYPAFVDMLAAQEGHTTLDQRKTLAAQAFAVVAHYDNAINNWFHPQQTTPLRYGENPHQQASFAGDLEACFTQLHGKELSYNNLVDVDAAIELIHEFKTSPPGTRSSGAVEGERMGKPSLAPATPAPPARAGLERQPSETKVGSEVRGGKVFAIIKHTNVCGAAVRPTVHDAWTAALAGDPESAFGGVLVTTGTIDAATATAINEIFFEVLIAPAFDEPALLILRSKKNRILLQLKQFTLPAGMYKSVLNGTLRQDKDRGNYERWEESGGRTSTDAEKADLIFANILCKHLKSNAIALVKNGQLVGKGCGQTSRVDALRHAIAKAGQFNFNLSGAVMASDAFFPFNDCVQLGHEAGITAFIQPGGSIRDKDSITYCQNNDLVMVLTGTRHFKH